MRRAANLLGDAPSFFFLTVKVSAICGAKGEVIEVSWTGTKRTEGSVPMLDKAHQSIANAPLFSELVRKRNKFALMLSITMLVVYYAFVLFASTDPTGFAVAIGDGTKIPVGLIAGWAIQLFAFLLTGIYVYRANTEFDAMNKAIIEEATR
jgi:uncharacterized membrane protein (DUF485 family)